MQFAQMQFGSFGIQLNVSLSASSQVASFTSVTNAYLEVTSPLGGEPSLLALTISSNTVAFYTTLSTDFPMIGNYKVRLLLEYGSSPKLYSTAQYITVSIG